MRKEWSPEQSAARQKQACYAVENDLGELRVSAQQRLRELLSRFHEASNQRSLQSNCMSRLTLSVRIARAHIGVRLDTIVD